METLRSDLAEWGVETRSIAGTFGCGDDCVVQWHRTGGLVAVVDGLGHGPDASLAAHAALQELRAHAEDPPERLLERCHQAARRTRGLTMAIASIDANRGRMAWLGVGNVQGILVRASPARPFAGESLLVRSGVVGHRIPPIVPAVVALEAGDVLALATDGIRSGFESSIVAGGDVRTTAARILKLHARATDDALVVVVRYLGPPR